MIPAREDPTATDAELRNERSRCSEEPGCAARGARSCSQRGPAHCSQGAPERDEAEEPKLRPRLKIGLLGCVVYSVALISATQ